MGLCKCPRKNVTIQFCFEHRVNVCEYCMVSNHSRCIVQSYLLWLNDCEYDPNCQLCRTPLEQKECVRLVCYHVFHWDCLNKYASELFPHTAPAGYTCPMCNANIFPSSNMVSPVAEALRNKLLGVNWARCGLAFPIVDETTTDEPAQANKVESSPRKSVIGQNAERSPSHKSPASSHFATQKQAAAQNTDVKRMMSTRPEPYGAVFSAGNFPAPRKMYDSTDRSHPRPTVVDHDEDKYKRRSAFEWFSRWFHSKTYLSGTRRRDPNVFYKKWVVLGMLALIAICTLSVLFLRMGRASADADPLLDPRLNPNIRVQDGVVDDSMKDGIHHVVNAADKNNINDGIGHIRPR